MYATVRVYKNAPGFADALVSHDAEVRKLIEGIEGFKAYYVLETPDGAASITVYENEAGAQASNQAAAAWVGENLTEFTNASPQISAGEVVLHF
jgi:heme-degrading monooxygenase HmoA